MIPKIVHTDRGVTLVGGGDVSPGDLDTALALAPFVVAADGGAAAVLRAGVTPRAVIGDLDSLSEFSRAQIPPESVFEVSEQDSTDFEKALRRIDARLVVGLGFLGPRIDHQLATLSTLVALPDVRCVLVGALEVLIHMPPRLSVELAPGDTVSLFPMRSVTGRSRGLEWPIDGLTLAPGARVGTSNRATGAVSVETDGPGLIGVFPKARLKNVVQALAG